MAEGRHQNAEQGVYSWRLKPMARIRSSWQRHLLYFGVLNIRVVVTLRTDSVLRIVRLKRHDSGLARREVWSAMICVVLIEN